MVLRFDVRQINDLVTFRVGRERKEHWIIAACNDGYLRVFSLKNLQLHKVIKGLAGNPICIDIAKTNGSLRLATDPDSHRDLVAVGYQDNSFVIYSILQGFKPLYRGFEHRSFVCQVKFDNYFMLKQLYRDQEEEKRGDETSEVKQNIASALGAEEQKSDNTNGNGKLRKSSKSNLVDLLRKNTTRSLTIAGGLQREYRLISAGEDGMVFFWNVLASYNGNDLSKVEVQDQRNPMNLLVKVQPGNVTPLRSIHQIHLTETGQLYALIIGPKLTVFVDNTGIMTFYEVKHLTEVEDLVAKEQDRLAKVAEEAEEAERKQKQREAER